MRFNLIDILRLYRLHTALVTASVPGLVAYIVGGGPFLIVGVVIGSIFHHAWGFSLNEIVDIEVDRGNPELSHKPLVSGRITKRQAGFLSFLALGIAFISFFIGAFLDGYCPVVPVIFLFGATISGVIYDLYGKRFPLSDIFVASWYSLLLIAAASTVKGWGPYPIAVWAAVSLGFLHILFNNSVEGGLKDVENDLRAGARTLAVASGCRVDGGKLRIPWKFLLWSYSLRGAFIISVAVFTIFTAEEGDWGRWIMVTVPLIALFVFIHGLTFLQKEVEMDRNSLIKRFAIHEILSFAVSLMVLLPIAGLIPAAIAFIAPILWVVLFNRLIFRSTVAPRV